MLLSVIISTWNRADSLWRLLGSLEAMACPDSIQIEILVVDNGSSDHTWDLLSEEQDRPRRFPLRALREPQRGKARSLNLGLDSSSGSLLLVLDDDVVVHSQWLVQHLEGHRETSYDAIQGRVLPGVDPEGIPADPNRLLEYNIPIVDRGDKIRSVRGLLGTNLSMKRGVFERVGYFDPRLGPGASGFSEDTEYSMRIRQAGFQIGYTPYAVVYHELNPSRYGRAYNRLIHFRQGISRSLYRQVSIPFRVLPDLLLNILRFVFYRSVGKKQKAYKTEGRIMKCWGYLVGKSPLRHRKMGWP